MNKKLEKISLNRLEMNCFFGGDSDSSTFKDTTSQAGSCTDEDTTIDINGLAYSCTRWICAD